MNSVTTPQEHLQKLKEFDEIRKSTTAVTGLELVRQDLEDELKLAANLDTPLRNRLKRLKGEGKAHAYYKLVSNAGTTVTGAKFLGTDPTNMAFAKGGLPNSVDPQYQYIARPYSNIGDVLIVPWQDIAQDKSYIDIMAQQRRVKMLNVGLAEEYFILNGSSAATNGLAFDGLITQQAADGFNILDVSASGGSVLTYDQIRSQCFTIRLAGGQTRALVMSYSIAEKMTQMLGGLYAIRQMQPTWDGKQAGGFQVDSWNFGTGPVDIIADQYMLPRASDGTNYIFMLDDHTQDSKNSGNAVVMVDVDPIHYVDLMAITTANRGIVYETSMLQVGITQYQGYIIGITTGTPVLN
jgi:hypothetical protein